jgi:hypothetical protein
MPAIPIANPANGESLVGTEPELLQQVDPVWRRRMNLFTGRTLSDTALRNEQQYRAGSLATLGQSVSAGTVSGLALTLEAGGADPLLVVTPGYGISGSGEDAALDQTLKTRLSSLAVVDAATGTRRNLTVRQIMADPTNTSYAGILVVQPVIAEVSGQFLDSGGPLVVSGNLGASCGQDPAEYAFEDWQIADAVQLVYVSWPSAALPLPPPSPAASWRNRLAGAIFDAESQLGPDDQLPWTSLGVPVGLIAFDAGATWAANAAYVVGQFVMDGNGNRQRVATAGTTGGAVPTAWNSVYGGNTIDGSVTWTNDGLGWKPLFVDCSAVVRAGGLPRRRYALPAQPPRPQLWQSNTPYAVGDFIIDPNGNVQNVATAGTSGGPPPPWSTTLGASTADGGVEWSNNGPARWHANTAFNLNQFIFDSKGHRQNVAVAGTSGASEPDWSGMYLPTSDGSITWVNNGVGTPPVIQPTLAQARINQLSEQLGQTMAQRIAFKTLADICPMLPPSGILPAAALDFPNRKALWLPPNWSVTAAPVRLEELETALETGMMTAMLAAETAAPGDPKMLEPVEVLVPLPDALYDSNVLVVETVAPIFQQELNQALDARNFTLQEMYTAQTQVNVLLTAVGPNVPYTTGIIDPNTGLTPQEIAGRNLYPPYTPAPGQTFATVMQSTWAAGATYGVGAFVIDTNGAIQVATVGGASGAANPTWSTATAGITTDGAVTWLNNGSWSWAPDSAYVAGQFVIDAAGYKHIVTVSGRSASKPPQWNDAAGAVTLDGVIWQAGGQAIWQPNHQYAVGTLILDTSKNVQIVQTGGISGDAPPSWSANLGQTTQDSGVTWNNLGSSKWQPNTVYPTGCAILDSNGIIQTAQIGGTSGANAPAWSDTAGTTTTDAAINWSNAGQMTWQANFQYAAGTVVLDSNSKLQMVKVAGTSAARPPAWSTTPGGATTDNGITWVCVSFLSTDVAHLLIVANQAPYVISYTDSAGKAQTVNLLSPTDVALLGANGNGLSSLIASLHARISSANDLLDTAFLTSQTDIYRYRQNVLGATAATTLATSPVLANIASGSSAAATAVDLQSYISSIQPAASTTQTGTAPPTTTTTLPPTFIPPKFTGYTGGVVPGGIRFATSLVAPSILQRAAVRSVSSVGGISSVSRTGGTSLLATRPAAIDSALRTTYVVPSAALSPTAVSPDVRPAVTPTEITSQSPLSGAQINIRTLTVAERLAQSPSQEAMFYSIANRLSFLNALKRICQDLGLVVDDLQILIDQPPADANPGSPARTLSFPFGDWRSGAQLAAIQTGIQAPYFPTDAPEATLFSVGVRVVEQHTTLLRALEARVKQYSDFLALCGTALDNMQSNVQQAQVYLAQLGNALHQERQNVAFTSALLSDETSRVAQVNAQRQQVLQSAVQLVAYTRARTLEATDTVPSRQLVPTNIANPVPACLQQSVSIPPELREIVGQLREAPLNWLPVIAAHVSKLERPILLQQLALSTRARAMLQLQSTLMPSSAAGEAGVYAATVSKLYGANQQVFRNFQTQRAAIQPEILNNLSWSLQVANVQNMAAVNDLISSDAVHAEVSNAVARLIQQISSVATCLYTRASIALPVDRLAWAEYLQGAGVSVGLRSLAVLPRWNDLTYVDRQQMQLLVDWLFGQIDTGNVSATAFMSDVVRTAILLASDVPIDNVLSANIIARVQPAVGRVVSLNLTSSRVASGMYVHLYSGADLAARAVVTDLDSSTVSATVTDVFKTNVFLETTDTVHITAQTPQAVALRSVFA